MVGDTTNEPIAIFIGPQISVLMKTNGSLMITGGEAVISTNIRPYEEKLNAGYDGVLGTSHGITIFKKEAWIMSTDSRVNTCNLNDQESKIQSLGSHIANGEDRSTYEILTTDGYLYRCGNQLEPSLREKVKPL